MAVNEEKGSCQILIGGKMYDKMLSMNLRRSMLEGTCSGTIVLSWPGAEQFTREGVILKDFVEGADGQIKLDGQTAATIILDTRNSKGTPKSYELTLHFRGQMSDLVDSSVDHETGQENNKQPKQIFETLMKGAKGKLIDKTMGGGMAEAIKRFIVAEGETVERAGRRLTRNYGLSFFEDENGDWVLHDGKNAELGGGELRLGHNFTDWQTTRNLSMRYNDMNIFGSSIPDNQKWGKETEDLVGTGLRTLAGGFGGGAGSEVGRYFRGLVDGDHTKKSLQDKAEFDQNRRASQGLNVTLKMSTWVNNTGKIWKCNTKYRVVIPIDEIDDELVVREVEFELTPESRSATLILVNQNAMTSAAPTAGETNMTDPSRAKPQPQEEPEQPKPPPPPPPSRTTPPTKVVAAPGSAIQQQLESLKPPAPKK